MYIVKYSWSLKNTGLNIHLYADVLSVVKLQYSDPRLFKYIGARESRCGGPSQLYILLRYLTLSRFDMLIPGVGWIDVCKSYVHIYTYTPFSFSTACMRRKRPQENSERNARTEWRKSGGLRRPMLVLAKRYSLSRKIQKCQFQVFSL